MNIPYTNIILGSQSPRRKQLLEGIGIPFSVKILDIDESFPCDLKAQNIPLYLCRKKADHFTINDDNTLLITADTIVWINEHVLNKPIDLDEAKRMLKELSGNLHQVYTGVCIKSKSKTQSFYCETNVYFKNLSDNEIEYYLRNFKPLDKAGSYGVQEWIGYIGIERLEGSYFNVMGLPTKELYEALLNF
jgi:septum formation protein